MIMEDPQAQRSTNSALAVVALLLAIPALIISVLAYNRAGRDIDTDVNQRLTQLENNTQLAFAKGSAAVKLAALRARIEANNAGENVQAELDDIEAELRSAYDEVGGNTQQEWNEFSQDFDQVGNVIEQGGEEALNALQNLIDKLQENLTN